MSIIRFGLVTLAIAVLFADQTSAQNNITAPVPQEDPKNLIRDEGNYRIPFKSKPARQLMSKEIFDEYERALALFDCQNAGSLLNRAFIRQYPQFERARMIPKCRNNFDCLQWIIYAEIAFKEYGHCEAISQLNEAEDELRQRNITLPKFAMREPWKPAVNADYWIARRDRALATLIVDTWWDYVPALIKLADLVRRGDVFNAGDDVEYYILQRACLLGDDCSAIIPRLAKLRKSLAPDRIVAIDGHARASEDLRPVLYSLLLGETNLD